MPANQHEPAQTMAQATAELDFEIPLEAGDCRYVDLNPARGESNATKRLKKLLERQPDHRWLHAAFASHRGAGKTTELKQLADQIKHQYDVIYLESNVEMDAVKFSMEDLLLVLARVVEERMRLRGEPLDHAILKKVEDWFSEVVFTDDQGTSYLAGVQAEARAEGGIPFFAKLMTAITSTFRVESAYKESVKTTLRKYPGTLQAHVNNLLDGAAAKLKTHGLRLLVMIDNMDRYEPRLIDEVVVQGADRFKGLRCHLIVTPPIGLVLKPESVGIDAVFHCETMPTVKLREPSQSYQEFSGLGREFMLSALGRRIDLNRLMPDATARDRLVAGSGGAIRELLELALDATLIADGDVITHDDVDRALRRRRQFLRDRADANGWWPTLARIASTKRLDHDPAALDVVYQRLAFQYNGEIWYDVHPLLSDLPEIQKALKPPRKRTTKSARKKDP